ncbi:MAG: hypothetical protein ISN29_02605 [Gammaproteobacteria bacterium AqS3]|nr:hypothetical protein [Gammaproteobacteria bacterium AqS3]
MRHKMYAIQYQCDNDTWLFDRTDDTPMADGVFYFNEAIALDELLNMRHELSSIMSMEAAKRRTRIVKIHVKDWDYEAQEERK